MKKIVNRIALAFLCAIPIASESYTIGYSPTGAGQPLVFILDSMRLSQFSAVTWSQLQNALFIQSTYSNHFDDLFYRNCSFRTFFTCHFFGLEKLCCRIIACYRLFAIYPGICRENILPGLPFDYFCFSGSAYY